MKVLSKARAGIRAFEKLCFLPKTVHTCELIFENHDLSELNKYLQNRRAVVIGNCLELGMSANNPLHQTEEMIISRAENDMNVMRNNVREKLKLPKQFSK